MSALQQFNTNLRSKSHSSVSVKRHGSYKSSFPPTLLRWIVFTADLLISGLIAISLLITQHVDVLDTTLRTALPYMLFPVAVMLGISLSGAYGLSFSRSIDQHVVRAANGAGAGLLSLAILIWNMSSAPGKYIFPIALTWASVSVIHIFYAMIMKRLFKVGSLSEKVVIIGATDRAEELIRSSQASGAMRVLGIFDDRADRSPDFMDNVPILGSLNDLMDWERLPEVDRIIVTITTDARDRVSRVLDRLRVLPHRIVLMLDLQSFGPEDTGQATVVGTSPAAYVSGRPINWRRVFVKRMTDLVFGIGLLIAFSPLMLITALLIKLEDGGPVFFRQMRHGFNNEVIRVWKFRSMRVNKLAEQSITSQTTWGDCRVTGVGRFIRTTSIDELPQLFNVIAGNMSLVGSRPHARGMTAQSTLVHEIVSEYAHRHRAKPGLTGWAQVNGSRGPIETHAEVKERVRLDIEYLKRSSFWFDIYIMLRTAPCLLGDGKSLR